MQLKQPRVGGRRGIEGDLLAGLADRRVQLGLVAPSGDYRKEMKLESCHGLVGFTPPARQRRKGHFVKEEPGSDVMCDKPVTDLARQLGHLLAHAAKQHRRVAVRVRARIEERCHQSMPVEFTAKSEAL